MHQYLSTIEGALIDLFLNLLVYSDESQRKIVQKNSQTAHLAQAAPLPQTNQNMVFKLKPSGASHVINFLKQIIESSKVNMTSFFSIERIVVSLIRKVTVSFDKTESQVELVLTTLAIIFDKLLESAQQVIFYFLESYLREFLLRLDESTGTATLFEQLNNSFYRTLLRCNSYLGELVINQPISTSQIC